MLDIPNQSLRSIVREGVMTVTPARVPFATAVTAIDDGFVAQRIAWPVTSFMTKRGGPHGTLYVITLSGSVVHLTDADRAANDWIVYDPAYGYGKS